MGNNILETIESVDSKKKYESQLNSFLWGTVEIREVKGGKYIYLHKRVSGFTRMFFAGEQLV